jgi:hypothetical protein
MLALSLSCAGCTTSRVLPYLGPQPQNAVLVALPEGTEVRLPTPDSAAIVAQALAGQARPADPRTLRLGPGLRLCTEGYIAERDLVELRLIQSLDAARSAKP